MKPLLCNQPLPEEPKAEKTKAKRIVGASVGATFNLPGNAYILKNGKGSNARRAAVDAINEIFKDTRLKGKRASSYAPVRLTVNFFDAVSEE